MNTIPIIDAKSESSGVRVFEALYAEAWEKPLHIGLFRTKEMALEAALAWLDPKKPWYPREHLCVVVRILCG